MSVIEARDVVRVYGRGPGAFTAVDRVSLRIDAGELVAILGVNGAGKTSLVEVLEGLAPADSGTVRVLGLDPVRDRGDVRSRTGIMLQEAGFAADLTVAETLRMWAGTLDAPRPLDEALALTGLAHRSGVRVGSLSGGEQRRLDLAMAILGRPEVLFLDEPTTGLDPASRRRTWDLVSSMLAEGATVVLTTHYMDEAEQLADRILIMESGRIVSEGSPRDLASSRSSTVSFADAPALVDRDLASLPGVVAAPVHERGRTLVSSSDLADTVPALVAYAAARGARLEQFDARSASLEDAFLSLTADPHAPRP
ncbi:ABC transporter ATP-binding protein [Actinomyces sp. B33]|uniref:ABC transporter ATP-binding protein n=1 Tax=Actinomyces sp. B33 TaxID=2942131 RepID=UPI002341C0BD|nr:ABC transporter ATP-binding protein [Actinomyces sp. B33]MDC4233160.1 ABC transporter ATP-binding protein [Actinomyces sp. B33]